MAVAEHRSAADVSASSSGRDQGIQWGRVAAWTAMVLLVLVTLFPLWWVLRTALSANAALYQESESLLPVGFTWINFKRVLGLATTEEALAAGGSGASFNFALALRNSVIVAVLITAGQVTFCAMSAYAFARLRFPGRDQLFIVFLAALMVPPIFALIPNFILIRDLGWLNTFQGIVAPYFLMTPFAVFFLRQFFLSVSTEVEEAGRIDGAGPWQVFARIVLPLMAAPLTTLAVLTYIQAWNEYLWPLVVGQEEDVRVLTVALGLFRSQTPQGAPDWAGLMAGTFLAAVPIFVLFLLLGRRVVDSIGYSGIK